MQSQILYYCNYLYNDEIRHEISLDISIRVFLIIFISVQAEQFETIEKCNALKKSMEGNLNLQKFHVWQKDVITLKRNLQTSFSKVL